MSRRTSATTIDEYLALSPIEIRTALERLCKTIKSAAPEATEGISYQILRSASMVRSWGLPHSRII
jgi:uncharacterized protein YdhG (YjbR/CyaY superfamily)